ncbi:Helix-turn-helix domain [Nocardiopsis dassonvillei]|nr:Helix-turn-helix domain [Nocardiopsis dassonvillei]
MSRTAHANARLTPAGRLTLARCVVEDRWPPRRAAERFQTSTTTAQRWADRYREHGEAGMHDRPVRAAVLCPAGPDSGWGRGVSAPDPGFSAAVRARYGTTGIDIPIRRRGVRLVRMVREPLTADQIERGRLLGALLRRARAERTMVDVAREARISVETLRKIEGGRIPTPTFFTVAAIADALGLSLDELLRRVDAAATAARDPATASLAV